jgi:hypothetical protein
VGIWVCRLHLHLLAHVVSFHPASLADTPFLHPAWHCLHRAWSHGYIKIACPRLSGRLEGMGACYGWFPFSTWRGVFLLSAGRPAPAFFWPADAEVILIDLAYRK